MTSLDQNTIEKAIIILNQGGLIGYPTEGVYGLGCDPFNPIAVEKIYTLKKRSRQKPFILVASDADHIIDLIDLDLIPSYQTIIDSWPSATTWVLPLSQFGKQQLHIVQTSIAIRVSAHPIIQALCSVWQKPLVSTSANLSNQPPIKTYNDMQNQFDTQLDLIIPGKIGHLSGPTPIIDAITGQVLRQGVDSNDP